MQVRERGRGCRRCLVRGETCVVVKSIEEAAGAR